MDGHIRAASGAEKQASSLSIGAELAELTKKLLAGGNPMFRALGFASLPEFRGRDDAQISELLDQTANDLAFSAETQQGLASNERSLADKAAERYS